MSDSLYYVRVTEDGKTYRYEYGNLPHALQHCKMEAKKGLEPRLSRYDFASREEARMEWREYI